MNSCGTWEYVGERIAEKGDVVCLVDVRRGLVGFEKVGELFTLSILDQFATFFGQVVALLHGSLWPEKDRGTYRIELTIVDTILLSELRPLICQRSLK